MQNPRSVAEQHGDNGMLTPQGLISDCDRPSVQRFSLLMLVLTKREAIVTTNSV